MIAVSFALPAESSGLIDLLQDKQSETIGPAKIVRGKIGERAVAIVYTGVGRKSCQNRIDKFLDETRPKIFIGAGFAGAVREGLEIGELVLAENFSDPRLLLDAQEILRQQNGQTIKLFTAATIVDSIEERNRIAREHGADAVEMETEYIAAACAARAIPMLSLRAISDSPGQPFPAPPNVLFNMERQKTDGVRLALYLLTHPMAIGRLSRFAGQVGQARNALAQGLAALIKQLLEM
jgi:adenosylhomocysteine nucleosidase